jgi:glycosyltransferase involved in cell wall biosynthesis
VAPRPTVLVLMGSFWPGGDASGPNQSLRGLCAGLGEAFAFRILARDRPFGARARMAPAPGWTDTGFAQVAYLEIGRFGARGLRRLLRETPYDLLLLNGFFDREFTLPVLIMRRLGLIPRRPVLLSPRGEFGGGALSLKSRVKRAWLAVVRLAGLLDGVVLHATSEEEASDIAARLAFAPRAQVAANVRPIFDRPAAPATRPDGPLRLVFLGRVTAVKNLGYALQTLKWVDAPLIYDIFGPISDRAYGKACEAMAATLPPHVQVRFMGEIANADAPATLAAYDLMYLPSRGENFGHAIFEALAASTPVLISDRTPWRDLESRRAGFDLPLDDPRAFAAAIDRMAALSPAERALWRDGARAAAERASRLSDAVGRSRAMLNAMLGAPDARR